MRSDIIKKLNIVILSMAAKQSVLNNLKSNFFEINIYKKYIETLVDLNLDLLDLEGKKEKYLRLIDQYITKEIKDPDEVILILKNEIKAI